MLFKISRKYIDSRTFVRYNQNKFSKMSGFIPLPSGKSIKPNDDKLYLGVREYIYLKVRCVFDPPTSSSVADAMKKSMDELEWRLLVQTGK